MHRRRDDKFLVKSVYLYYNPRVKRLVATQTDQGIGIPFVCSPEPRTQVERYAYNMYPSNNLYYIITNGGVELTPEQLMILTDYKEKLIGKNNKFRIINEDSVYITREDIHNLLVELNQYITKEQLLTMAKFKGLDLKL